MVPSILPVLILLGPLAAAILVFATPARRATPRMIERVHLASVSGVLAFAIVIVADVIEGNTLEALDGWLYIDPVAAIFVLLIGIVGFLTGVYSIGFIRNDFRTGAFDRAKVKIYYGFFSVLLFTMLLAVTSNNIVMMWVAIEATTLGSAFLVGIYGDRTALEAAWKYVVICTVGVAFGLYGTVLVYANGNAVLADPDGAVLWTTLAVHASSLDPTLMKLAFVFALIGFGTKAGLFPMHGWLPDAYAAAPSPVSGLLSGALSKCALFAIIRYYGVTMQAVGPEFPQLLVLVLGVLSIGVASFLFFVQQDLKRKLAYSSIEHIGLIAIGLGFGGPLGVGAALLHVINHGLTKALLFCVSGNVLMKYGSGDLRTVKGLLRIAPSSGLLLMAACLALGGFPPFNVFVSEFLIFAAGLKAGYVGLMIICALFLTVTVAGLIQIISGSVLGKSPEGMPKGDAGWLTLAPMAVLLALMLVMGVAVPRPVSRLIQSATAIVLGQNMDAAGSAPWPFQALLPGQEPGSIKVAGAPGRIGLADPRSTPISAPSHRETHE
jgi:hydrogenase-4 component F